MEGRNPAGYEKTKLYSKLNIATQRVATHADMVSIKSSNPSFFMVEDDEEKNLKDVLYWWSGIEAMPILNSNQLLQTGTELVKNILGEGQSGWNTNTFSGWGAGYIPVSETKLTKVNFTFGQVNANYKLVLKVYSRPISESLLTTAPGGGANDIEIYTNEILTSSLVNTSALQPVSFSLPEINVDTAHLYLFHVKGVTQVSPFIGVLGTDRTIAIANTLPVYDRGFYNGASPFGTPSFVSATAEVRIAFSVEAKNTWNKLDRFQTDLDKNAVFIRNSSARQKLGNGTLLYSHPALSPIPGGWTATNWVSSGGGIAPTATGLANYLGYDAQYSASKRKARVLVTLGATTRFMLFTKQIETNSNQSTIVECNVPGSKIRIYAAYNDNNTLPAMASEKAYTFVAGRDYIVELIKNDWDNEIRVTDSLTGLSDSLVDSTNTTGRQHDQYAMCCYSGTFPIVKNFQISTAYEPGCLIYLLGDSLLEARYSPLVFGDGHAYKLINALSGNGGISGRGSGTIDGLIRKLESEVAFIRPAYVAMAIGTNAGNTITKLNQAIDRVLALGSIPILCSVPRRSGGADVSVNADITSVRSLRNLRGARFDIATSLNNNVASGQNTSMFIDESGTLVHTTAAGQLSMFDRWKLDVPELLL